MLGPDGKPLEVVAVEKAGEEAWAGVAGIDKGEDASAMTPSDIALLAAGDAAALLLFAAVGRVNHGEPLNAETFTTALPFVVGLLATSPFLGGFSKAASKSGAGDAALTAAKCWAVGVPAGIVLRSIGRGYWPANSFIIATMAATGVFLIGWRTAYAALAKKEEPPKSASAQVAARKDKKGNPFEFVQLLMSLTKRW